MEKSLKRVKKNLCFLVTLLWYYKYAFCLKLSYIKLVLLQVWNIQTLLMESLKDETQAIKDLAERVMVKFNKY